MFENGSFNGGTFKNSTFDGVSFKNCELINAKLINCSFARANLSGVNFTGATLTDVDFSGAILERVDFTNAKFSSVKFDDNTKLNGVKGLTMDMIQEISGLSPEKLNELIILIHTQESNQQQAKRLPSFWNDPKIAASAASAATVAVTAIALVAIHNKDRLPRCNIL